MCLLTNSRCISCVLTGHRAMREDEKARGNALNRYWYGAAHRGAIAELTFRANYTETNWRPTSWFEIAVSSSKLE